MVTEIDSYLTLAEVAKALAVHVNTVRRLIYRGELVAVRISERGDIRVGRRELEAFLAARTTA